MYILKGFMVIQALSDNQPGQVATLGELSTWSKTFTRELGHYSRSAHPDVDFKSFLSKDDSAEIEVPPFIADTVIEIGQWMYEGAASGLFTVNTSNFVSALLGEFSNKIDNVATGQMVTNSKGNNLPEYIQFTHRDYDDNFIKIWFTDDSFRRQYDEYEIEVVPPIENIDDLLGQAIQVKALLDQVDDSERMHRIQVLKDRHPNSITKVEMFDWSNPIQSEITLRTSWGIIIYGPAGDTLDNIRNELIHFILDNSEYERNVWEDYLPDIFKITEFTILPFWDIYSIPNETLHTGLHSPSIQPQFAIDRLVAMTPEYPEEHTKQHIDITVSNYRSLSLAIVGGPDNRDDVFRFYDQFKDYIVIPSSSAEFGRMSPKTQSWVMLLAQMLKICETMDEFSDIPIGMSKLERDGILYLVASYDEIQYLVVSMKSYQEKFGGVFDEDEFDEEID